MPFVAQMDAGFILRSDQLPSLPLHFIYFAVLELHLLYRFIVTLTLRHVCFSKGFFQLL